MRGLPARLGLRHVADRGWTHLDAPSHMMAPLMALAPVAPGTTSAAGALRRGSSITHAGLEIMVCSRNTCGGWRRSCVEGGREVKGGDKGGKDEPSQHHLQSTVAKFS